MSAARTKNTTQQSKEKDKPKLVRCIDCENEIPDTDGISFRMSDHFFFLCNCACGHHIDKYGKLSKLFREHERYCKDHKPKTQKAQ